MKHKTWVILFLLLGTAFTYSQNNVKFTNLSITDGLPNSDVRAIVQDPYGFMWFGTGLGGLARFDGYEFKVYTHDPQNPHSLAYNSISSLYVDKQGTLWIGTLGGGLDRYDEQSDTFVHFRHHPGDAASLLDNTVLSFCEDRNGFMWIGTKGGLSRFDRKNGTFLNFKANPSKSNAIAHLSVRCIYEDPLTGMLWIGAGGITVFNPETEKVVDSYFFSSTNQNSLSNNGVNCIMKDRKGIIWVGTDNGLNRFVPKTKSFVRYQHNPNRPESLINNRVVNIIEDGEGRFWVATRNGMDLMDRKTGKFVHYRNNPSNRFSLSDNVLLTTYVDHTGMLWIGTFNKGVDRVMVEAKAFDIWQHQIGNSNSLSNNNVLSIKPDSQNRLWIGTQDGLNLYNHGKFTHFFHDLANKASLSSNTVGALAFDTSGILWIGTTGGGLCGYDGIKFKHFNYAPQYPFANRVTSLCPGIEGGMWFAVAALGVFHASKWGVIDSHISPENSTSLPYLCRFDANDNLWIGSQDDGIMRLDPKTDVTEKYLVNPQDPASEKNKQFYDICPVNDTVVWVGSVSGLYLFNPKTKKFSRQFTRKDGLPADGITSILPDDSGNIWLGTINGLTRFNPKNNTFRNYNIQDGLPGLSFNPRAAAKTPDGKLYFGTSNGLVSFYPQNLKNNTFPPPVALTEFTLFDKPVVIDGNNSPLKKNICSASQITLQYNQSVFGFKFSALSYIAPGKSRYAYKMEGFDPDWRYANAEQRYVTYTSLPPGHYVFRVKASNNDGIWNEQGKSINIIIIPPWWQTWWFRGIIVFGIMVLIYTGFRWRTRNIKRNNRKLEQLVVERTFELEAANKELEAFAYSVSHDLRTPLRSIDGFSHAIIEDYQDKLDEEGKDYLNRIRSSAQRMSQLIDDILKLSRLSRDVMNIETVNLSSLAQNIMHELKDSQPQRDVNIKIQDGIIVKGDKRLLRIAFDNLLGNAWKFTSKHQEADIEFGMIMKEGKPIYYIKDDGAGFDMNYAKKLFGAFQRFHAKNEFPGTGIGLATVQRIIHRHGGSIWAESEVERGATFYFTLREE